MNGIDPGPVPPAAAAQFERPLVISAFHCPNCTRLVQCAGNGTPGSPWVIPDHASPADGEPCQESWARWSRQASERTRP
jgi:hypothetical protein